MPILTLRNVSKVFGEPDNTRGTSWSLTFLIRTCVVSSNPLLKRPTRLAGKPRLRNQARVGERSG
jgi:hypothetical protein